MSPLWAVGLLCAVLLAAFVLWGWLARRPRLRASDAGLPPSLPIGQADPRVADLEYMDDDEIARFIADCAEAAAVIERQWEAANAELAERHRAERRG